MVRLSGDLHAGTLTRRGSRHLRQRYLFSVLIGASASHAFTSSKAPP